MSDDKPASPFARLDTSLLRSTRPVTDLPSAPAESATASNPPPTARPARERRREPKAGTTVSLDPNTTVDTTPPRHRDTTTPSPDADLIQTIRKAVRAVGKEAATLRLTGAEKQQLKDVVYTYTRRGHRTSENELIRIGTNYMLEDYRRNGERSILAQVLAALES